MIDDPDQDLFAAEYVLGTLDADERSRAEALRTSSPDFDAHVVAWERRLAPLMDVGSGIEAPPWLIDKILAEVDAKYRDPDQPNSKVVQLRRQVRVWRSTTGLAAAIAALLALWVGRGELKPEPVANTQGYVAVLHGGDAAPSFLVSLDLPNRRMVVVPSGAPAERGKSYELWMIGGDSPTPRSLGLLDPGGAAHPVLPTLAPGLISAATYAVTIEPQGGSPTGKPTTAPVYTGQLIDIPN